MNDDATYALNTALETAASLSEELVHACQYAKERRIKAEIISLATAAVELADNIRDLKDR